MARGPLRLPLGRFEVTRGVTTTIAIKMRRDNTGLSLGLSYMPTEGLPGITTEQRALMTAQSTQIGEYKIQNDALKALVKNLEERIDQQKKEIDKWKKLADRRGRAIEW